MVSLNAIKQAVMNRKAALISGITMLASTGAHAAFVYLGNLSSLLGDLVLIVPDIVALVMAIVPLTFIYIVIRWLKGVLASSTKGV